jgi:hypothetical protein
MMSFHPEGETHEKVEAYEGDEVASAETDLFGILRQASSSTTPTPALAHVSSSQIYIRVRKYE